MRALRTWWLTLYTCLRSLTASCSSFHDVLAPIHGAEHENAVKGSYAVFLYTNHTIDSHIQALGGRNLRELPNFREKSSFYGYVTSMVPNDLLESIRRDPGVKEVEVNRRLSNLNLAIMNNSSRIDDSSGSQSPPPDLLKRFDTLLRDAAPWGPQVISMESPEKLPNPKALEEEEEGIYETVAEPGKGVDIYILDSGIRISHPMLKGRTKNFPSGSSDPREKSPYCNGDMDDDIGHGTWVAGIAAGAFLSGIAPSANVWNVKVLCRKQGTNLEISNAIDDIVKEHKRKTSERLEWEKKMEDWEKKGKVGKKPEVAQDIEDFRGSVINMSWGGENSWSTAMLVAINEAYYAGITLFAAAGNANKDSSSLDDYPCNYASVDCVGAINDRYEKSATSNYGPILRWIAPGDEIISANWEGGTIPGSGTSGATPHVVATAAIITSGSNDEWLALADGTAITYLFQNSLIDVTTGWPDSRQSNCLVNSGFNNPEKSKNEPFLHAGPEPRLKLQTNYPIKPADDATKAGEKPIGKATRAHSETGLLALPTLEGPVATTASEMSTTPEHAPSLKRASSTLVVEYTEVIGASTQHGHHAAARHSRYSQSIHSDHATARHSASHSASHSAHSLSVDSRR